MRPVAIKVLGIVTGVVLANLIIFGWEAAGTQFARAPLASAGSYEVGGIWGWAGVYMVCGWAVGTLVGAYVAFATTRWDFSGWIVAALIAVAGLANTLTTHQSVWLRLAAVAVPFVATMVAFGGYRRWRASRLHLQRRR